MTTQPETLVAAVGADSDAVRLATLVSLAVRVEPGLLRRARLALAPEIPTAAEAELWFSPMVSTRTLSAIVLDAGVAAKLRQRLIDDRDPTLNERACRIVRRAHRYAPPTLRLEEKIIWRALTGADEEELGRLLARAIATMTEGDRRRGIARWAARALPTLPGDARESTPGRLLRAGAEAGLGLPARIPPELAGHPALARILPAEGRQVEVGLRLLQRGIEVSEPPEAGAQLLSVPLTDPIRLRIRPAGSANEHVVTVRLGEVDRHRAGAGLLSGPEAYDIALDDGRVARLERGEPEPPAVVDMGKTATTPVDPRLERFRPALVYDVQEAYRAMSAASITDAPGNALTRSDGTVLARAGEGLSLDFLSAYDATEGDRLDIAGDPLSTARRMQADPAYRERVYGRMMEDGGRTWLQYWLWFYYTPAQVLGFGKHEGSWQLVQIGLGDDGEPEVATYSQRASAEARGWGELRREGTHPVVYVAPLSHALYFEPGTHPYVLGIDSPHDALPPVLPTVEPFGPWAVWPGRWGNSGGGQGGRFGGRSPASPGRQGEKWRAPAAWHARARYRRSRVLAGSAVRRAGLLTYPRLLSLDARRSNDRVVVDYAVDRAPPRRATRLVVTLHRSTDGELLASIPVGIDGPEGTVEVLIPEGAGDDLFVRASAYNRLRQRSDPMETKVKPGGSIT
jgi:hypothetical protein